MVKGQYNCRFFDDLYQFQVLAFTIQKPATVQEILSKRTICEPLTIAMSAPTGDGGAAAIVCSEQFMKEHNLQVRGGAGREGGKEEREGGELC